MHGDRFIVILPYDGYRMILHQLTAIRRQVRNNVILKYRLSISKHTLEWRFRTINGEGIEQLQAMGLARLDNALVCDDEKCLSTPRFER